MKKETKPGGKKLTVGWNLHLSTSPSFRLAAQSNFDMLHFQRVCIGTMDLRIVSLALIHNTLLLSRNLVDFQKLPGLRVESWLD